MDKSDNLRDTKSIIFSYLFVILSLAGLFLSGYLWFAHSIPSARSSGLFQFCSVGPFDCYRVDKSEFSVILGLPLAAWGCVFYFTALIYFFLSKKVREGWRDSFRSVLLLTSLAAALSTVPLFIVSILYVRAFCLYCVLSWLCNIAIFIALFVSNIRETGGATKTLVEACKTALGLLSGFKKSIPQISLLILVPVVSILSAAIISSSPEGSDPGKTEITSSAEERLIKQFTAKKPRQINLHGTPIYYGSPDARVTIVEFFNFDCDVCRTATNTIKPVMDLFPGKVKLHLMHYPLDGRCNRNVDKTGDALPCKASLIAIALQKSELHKYFVDYILTRKERLGRELILDALASIKMDFDRLQSLTSEREAERELVLQIMEAETFLVHGTPTFIINGKALPIGLPPSGFLEKIIELEVRSSYAGD